MRSALLATAALVLLGGDSKPDETKNDVEKLAGQWTMAKLIVNGEQVSGEPVETAKLTIEKDRYTVTFTDRTISESIRVDASKSPKEIDFTYTDGEQKGQTAKGIYKLEGDTYTMCRAFQPDGERPTKFDAPADSGLLLVVWKRAPKSDAKKQAAIAAELKRFEGDWHFVSIEVEGQRVPENSFKESKLVLEGDRFTAHEKQGLLKGTFKVDPTVAPKTIDVTFDDGPTAGKSHQGIYELEGDTYKVCMALEGKPRPTEFASKPGNGQVLEVLKRGKP